MTSLRFLGKDDDPSPEIFCVPLLVQRSMCGPQIPLPSSFRQELRSTRSTGKSV